MMWIIVYSVLLIQTYKVYGQPVITNQPIVGNLPASTFVRTPVVDIPCEDSTDPVNGRIAVSLVNAVSTPTPNYCTECFQVYNLDPVNPNDWKLYFIPGVLDYFKAKRYDVRVTCRDSNDTVSPVAVIGVNIVPNPPPFFAKIYETINVTNSFSRTSGYSVYTAVATDTDSLFYSMTSSLVTDIFQINAETGEITLTKQLGGLCRTNILLYIEAVDNINPDIARMTLNINFLQMNLPAVITNMNRVLQVEENQGTQQLAINRIDTFQPAFTCNITIQIPTMKNKIYYDQSITSIVISTLNFELDSNTNVTLHCTDGLCPSEEKWLYIQIKDANDIPTLAPTSQSLTASEGFVSVQPNLILNDEDVNDQQVFYIVSMTPTITGFVMDQLTGILRTTFDFRVDKNNQTVIDFIIAANDTGGGQTNGVSVRLTVYDVNDNRPIITRTSFEYILEECHPLGVLDTLTATDADGGVNGLVDFEGASAGGITVYNNGTITLVSAPVANQFHTVEVYAVDKGFNGGIKRSPTPAVITLIGIPCSSTQPQTGTPPPPPVTAAPTTSVPSGPTLPPNQRKNNRDDLLWIALACVLGLIVATVLACMIYRCHRATRTRQKNISSSMADLSPRKQDRKVQPDTIPRRASEVQQPQAKHSQNDYFTNDVTKNYKEGYHGNKNLPSAVEAT